MASRRDEQARLIADQQATIAQLSASVTQLNTLIGELRAMMEQIRTASSAREQELQGQLEAMTRKALGKSSEKMPSPKDALRKKDATKADPAATQQKRRDNQAHKDALETVDVPHSVEEADRTCASCTSGDMQQGVTRQRIDYDYVPGYFRRRVHQQEVLVCGGCKTEVAAGRSVPIYRLEKQFKWLGIPMSRSTMTDLFHMTAEKLRPLYQRLLYRIAQSDIVLADETTLTMQDRAKRGYMWTFRTTKLIAYKFSPSRSGATPKQVLGGTTGTLVVDAYTGYNPVVDVDGRVRAGCLAHVRRKFFDALATTPEAQTAMDLILDVYRIEHLATERGLTRSKAHAALRDTDSRAAMAKLHAWLTMQDGTHLPKGPMGKAVAYALDNWDHLQVFLDDVRVPVDNNASERALKIVALGRKNFMFVGHEAAGQNLAVLYLLMATCEEHGVDPHAYLADVLLRVDDHPNRLIDELLPDRWGELQADTA